MKGKNEDVLWWPGGGRKLELRQEQRPEECSGKWFCPRLQTWEYFWLSVPSFGIQVPQSVRWDGCWLQMLEEHNLKETNTKKQHCDQKQAMMGHKLSCKEGWKQHYICRLGTRLQNGCNHWIIGVLGSFHPAIKYPVVLRGELKTIYTPDERSEGPTSSAGTSGSPFSWILKVQLKGCCWRQLPLCKRPSPRLLPQQKKAFS